MLREQKRTALVTLALTYLLVFLTIIASAAAVAALNPTAFRTEQWVELAVAVLMEAIAIGLITFVARQIK